MAPRVFLAFFILTSSLVVGQSPKYALKGGKVSFKPDITELPDGILWKHNGNKVVEFNGNEEQVYSPFDKRITLGWVSAELQITDLRFEDSGEYELEVEVKKALHHRSVHKLEVIDTVAEPTISCKMNDGSSSNSSAELECSSESRRPQPLKKFEWSTRGNVKPGPKLRISLGDERDDEVYSCSVSNPLSSKTATFTAKDCYPDKSSSVALIASLVSIFLLLLIVGAGVGTWFCKRHHKACFAKEDLEKQSAFRTARGDVDEHEVKPLTGRSPGSDVDEEYEMPQKGHVKDKRKLFEDTPKSQTDPADVSDKLSEDAQSNSEFTIAPETPAVDMDKQEEKPLTGRSPGTCDVNGKYVTPQKGHVKDKRKLFEDTPKSQTDEHKRTASPPSPPPSEAPSLDLNADADQNVEPSEEEVPEVDPSDSEKANEPDPAGVSDKLSDMDKQEEEPLKVRSPGTCDVDEEYETPQKGHVKDKAKRFGDRLHGEQTSFKKLQTENPTDEHKSTASPPPPPPSESPSPLDLNNPASNDDRDADADPYGEPAEEEVPHYDPSDSEKANEPDPADVSEKLSKDAQSDPEFIIAPEMPEPEKKADDEEKPETSPAVQPHSPATKSSPNMALEDTAGEHEEASDQVAGGTAEENVRESDSSEKKVSDDSSEDELSSNIPEQRGSKTSLPDKNVSQEEANTNKDNQQETVKPVSEDDDDTDKEPDLYLDASQQPQSPTPTKPDNKDADTPQESPPAAHPDPDREEEEEEPKTSRDSDKSDGQSDKGEGETDEGKKLHGLKEEKPGNESLSEDK